MRARIFLLAAALVSCADTTPRCGGPDASVAGCFCPNGRRGAQRCSDNGLTLGPCVCNEPDASPDGASDAAAD